MADKEKKKKGPLPRIAVGEQVEIKGRKYMVWQLDDKIGSVALLDWTTAVRVKQWERAKKNDRPHINPNTILIKRTHRA